uniref:D-3-phosphoglycerate dehydrogenase n=1 Tax=Hyaloperonospora arabidopsidis (strain Emoy2) TaxID=559515 RepID=M4BB46_HYAAE
MLRCARWTHRGSRFLRPQPPITRCFHQSSVSMARILCSDPIDPVCPELLRAAGHDVACSSSRLSHSELVAQVPEYDVLIVRSGSRVDRQVLDAAQKLQLIGRAGTGVDNIDLVNATKLGVLVLNTPSGTTISAAELTLGLIAAVSRLGQTDGAKLVVRNSEIHGKTLGLVGLGRIGREVATRCNAFGMNVIGYDPILSNASAKTHGIEPVALDELFSRSDYISLHVPLNANTKHLVNAQRLELCKDGVKIVNGARAGLIDHSALLEAMESGKVAGVAFDVDPPSSTSDTWKKLVSHDNVIVTPHIGALTTDAQEKVARDLAYKVNDALAGKSFKGVLNAPNIDFGKREELMPLLSLAEKLGSMQAQLLDISRLKRVLVVAEGPRVTSSELSGQLVNGVLKGLLSHMLEEEVTFANAKQLADIMGIQTVEHKHDEASGSSFSDQLTVIFEKENETSKTITGTVFGKDQLRFVSFDGVPMDAIPSGSMLLFNNTDQPGVLHNVTSVLAKHEINIGCFGLAREKFGTAAVGVLNVDEAIPDTVIEELEGLGMLTSLRRVNLLGLDTTLPDRIWKKFLKPSAGAVDEGAARAEKETGVAIVHHPKPRAKPTSPNFGSGPCKKRPGYSLRSIPEIVLGRSHRSKLGKGLLEEAIVRSKEILKLPKDYRLGIVPASDTGAFEMVMWSMLGERPVDVCYWESFGKQWFKDVTTELKLDNVREFSAPFGQIPDLTQVNCDHDVLFTWNGTTSGVRVPNADWIPNDRKGLIFNDATSAAFAMDIPWDKIDVCTFSWQKVLGGEGGHGVIILSPRAVERLESFVPENRPMPKIFRMTNASTGKLLEAIFEGSTINTPSMLCVEDYLDALRWAESVGGQDGLIAISQRNLKVIEDFAADNSRWFRFLAANKETRSSTSVCVLIDGLSKEEVKQMQVLLEREQVAYDVGSYRDAPPGLRIWCGATVETKDLEALLPWIKWAYLEVKSAQDAKTEEVSE